MKLKIKKLHPAAITPQYATDGSGCFDLSTHGQDWHINNLAYGCEIPPKSATTFTTGLSFEVPEGYVMLIFSRSGHGFKSGVRLSNCVGVIDSDYRGEVQVRLRNDGIGSMRINPGDRIAQALLVPIPRVEFEIVDELSSTERGAGGFGSTGSSAVPAPGERHGWVTPRDDGAVAKCGGPKICTQCQAEERSLERSLQLSDRAWAAKPANLREGCTTHVPGVGDI